MAYKTSLNTSQMLDMAHSRVDSGNGAENTNAALSAYAQRFNNMGAVARDNRTKSQRETDRLIEESNALMETAKKTDFWSDNWFGKALSTFGDVFFDVAEGLFKGVEGIVDFGAQVGAQVGSWFGADTSGIENFIEGDFMRDIVHIYDWDFYVAMQDNSYLRDMGVFGDIIEGVGHGVGQMLPSMLIGGGAGKLASIAGKIASTAGKIKTGVGMAVFTVGAMGSGAEEAYLDGATTEEASIYGLLSGAVEAGTEKFIGGGMSAMGSSSVLQKGLRKLSANTTVQKAIQFIAGAVGEGIEEIASDLINPVIKRVYDENSFDAYTDPEFGSQLLYDGVVGALTGMVLNVSQLTTRRQTNATYQELKTLETKAENIKNNKRLSPERKQAQLNEIQEQIKSKQALYADNINKLSKKIEVKQKDGDAALINAANTYLNVGENGKYSVKELDRNFSDSVSYGTTNADIKAHITDKGYKLYEGSFEGQEKTSKDLLDNAIININRAAEKSGKGTNTRLNYAIVENINDENISPDIDTQDGLQYNKKKTYYDQYNTEAKSWAFNSQRKVGDRTIKYSPQTNSWNELIADNSDEGFAVTREIKDIQQNQKLIDSLLEEFNNDIDGKGQGDDPTLRDGIEKERLDRTRDFIFDNGSAEQNTFRGNDKTRAGKSGNADTGIHRQGGNRYSGVLKQRNGYSQYNSEAMSWAFNSQRKEGDTTALYDPRTNSWNKLVAENTDDGYAVMQSIKDTPQNRNEIGNMLVEVENENNGRKQRINETLRGRIDGYKSYEERGGYDNVSGAKQSANGRDSGVYRAEYDGDRRRDTGRGTEYSRVLKDGNGKVYGYIEENSNLIVIGKDALNTELDFTFKYADGKTSTKKINAALSTLLHEATHFAEGTPEYSELAKFVLNNVKLDQAEITDLEQSYGLAEGTYKKAYEFVVENDFDFTNKDEKSNADERTAVHEVLATSMERLLADENYIRRLTQDNTSLAKRILNKIHNMWLSIKGEGKNESELRSILKTAEKLYNKAIANAVVAARTGELQYSLKGEQVDPEAKLTDLYGIDFYTEHELQNFENSSKIAIARNVADVIEFVSGGNAQSKIYIGKVNVELGNRISPVIGADITGYNISISKDFVLHIENNHSDIIAENNRGQIAINRGDIFNIIETVTNPDNIGIAEGTVEHQLGIEFTKNINGEYYTLGWISNRHHNLELKTAWKKGIKKRGISTSEVNANALTATSETIGDTASFNNSIREDNENVNTQNEKNVNISTEGIDNRNKTQYSIKGDADYERTDDFRGLQEESRGDFSSKSWEERSRLLDDDLRTRLSGVFGKQIQSVYSGNGNAYGLLKDTANFKIIENVDGNLFRDVFEISRTYLANGELVDLHDNYNNAKCYLTEDGLSGFAITESGDLISVFNVNNKRGFLRSISNFVKSNAKTLDCYASKNQNLEQIYSTIFGFKTAALMEYNMEYDHDNIAKNHVMPQVAFMVNTEAEVKTKPFNKDQYDAAVEYQQSFVNHTSYIIKKETVIHRQSTADSQPQTSETNGRNVSFTNSIREENANVNTKNEKNVNIPAERIDNRNKTQYPIKGDADYERTDDFRRLQEESRKLLNEQSELSRARFEVIDDGIRKTYSESIRKALGSDVNSSSYEHGILKSSKGTEFDIYHNVNPNLFHDAFETIKPYIYQNELVDLHDDYRNCKCFLSADGLQGFAIDATGNLISVFNQQNYGEGKKGGFVEAIKDIVIKEGATHLDCYGYLADYYSTVLGFKTVSIMEYNMEYDHHDIAKKFNNPKVAFMVNTEAAVETQTFNKDQYDAAVEYQQSFVNHTSENNTRYSIKRSKAAEERYNKYGWAKENNIVNNKEYRDFFESMSDLKNGAVYPQDADGNYIIAVGESDVKNTLIFTDGNYESPSVEKVIKINAENETDLSDLRSDIYEYERHGLRYEAEELFEVHNREDYAFRNNARRTAQSVKVGQGERDGSGVSGETRYSLKTERASSELTKTVKKTAMRQKDQYDAAVEYQQSFVNHSTENNTRYSIKRSKAAEERYNKYGWAKENNVVNNKEYRDFFESMSDLKNGAVYPQDADGNYIIAVGESDVKNTLIFTDGNYESPSVEKVIKINAENETDLSDIRSNVYAGEQSGLSYESDELFKTYTRETFEIRNDNRSSAQSVKVGQGERDGSGVSGETRYSLKTERASSELTKTVKKTAMQQVDEKIDDILDHSKARLSDSEKAALRNDDAVKDFRRALHDSIKEDGELPSLKKIIEEYPDQYGKVQKAIDNTVAATEASTFARESVKGLFEKNVDRAVSNTEKVDFSDAEKKKTVVSVLNKIKNYVAENCISVNTDKNGTESRRVKQLTAENIREISKYLSEVYNKSNPALEGRINDFAANMLKELQDLADNALDTVRERTTKEFEFARAVSVAMRELTMDDSIDMTAYGGKKTTNQAYAKDYKDSMERAHKIDPGSFALHNGFFKTMRRIGVSFADADAVFRAWDAYQSGGTRSKKGAMFYGLYQNIVAGEAKGRKKKIEMLSLIDGFYKTHKGYERSLTKTKIEVNDRDGNKVSMSKDHLISLVLTLESTHGMEHSLGDGLTLADGGSDLTVDLHFGYADLETLRSHLDAADKKFIDAVHRFFMIGAMAKAETDKYMFGFTRLQDPSTYYHLTLHPSAKAWGDFNENNYLTDPSANLSITKSISNSTEKLVVKGVNETMRYYANQIATYHGVAEALDVFNRAIDTKVDGQTMKSIADARSGGMFTEYVMKWIKDVQGIREVSPLTRIVERIRGGWVKFQLGANIKVIASQFSSAPMALTHVSVRGMTYALSQTPKSLMPKLHREMKQYSLQAELRYADNSGFNIGLLEPIAIDRMSKFGEVMMKPVEYTDEVTTAMMWNGVKFDIAKKYGVKVNELSEAQLTEAGKLLDEVILKDLPSYAMSTRSAFQRSTNPLTKGLVVQFVSDAIKQYSRLAEAFGEYRAINFEIKAAKEELKKADASSKPEIENRIKELEAERKRSRAQFGRTGGAVLTSMTMYAIIATAMQYLLGKVDDDDEETFVQKLAGQFGSTVLSLIPIAGNFINSWIDGYDADFWAISMINGIFDSIDGMTEMIEKGDASDMPKVFRSFLYNFGQIFGIPFRNMNTFVEAVLDKVDFFAGTGARFNYQGFFGKDNATRSLLQKALDNDDNGLAESIVNKMFSDAGLQNSTAAQQKLYKLVDKGYDVLPKAVGERIAVDGMSYELTRAQRNRFKKVYSQADETVSKLLSSSDFTQQAEQVQAKAIKFVYDYYYDEARYDFVGAEGDSKKAVFGQVVDVETLAKVYAVASSIESDTDRKGNVINGTKKRKIMNYLQSLRMTAAEKYLLLAFLGYTANGGETQIRSYLRKLNLSATESEIILAYCGYAA